METKNKDTLSKIWFFQHSILSYYAESIYKYAIFYENNVNWVNLMIQKGKQPVFVTFEIKKIKFLKWENVWDKTITIQFIRVIFDHESEETCWP